MIVYIVTRNGKVDAVFSSKASAENHRDNLIKLWALSEIKEFEVCDI